MRGVLTLVFDDGYEAVYRHVVPLLDRLKLRAVFALPLNTGRFQQTASESVKPWSDWLPLKAKGHEIAAHSITHTDLRLLTDDALTLELKVPHESLSATTLVYPGGAVSRDIVAEVKKYYTAARTTQSGFESLPPCNPWLLKTLDYNKDNFYLTKVNSRVLWAWLTNSWLIETYHHVDAAQAGFDTKPTTMHHSVQFADLERHLKFILKLSIANKTINEVIRDSYN